MREPLVPIHLFLYGSIHEMRSVEHNSVYRSFELPPDVVPM